MKTFAFAVFVMLTLAFVSPGLQRSQFPTLIGGQTATGTPVTLLVDSSGAAVTSSSGTALTNSNITQLGGTAIATAGYNSGNAVVVGFQSANISDNLAQIGGSATAVAGYNGGNAVVVGFQTGSISTSPSGTLANNGAAIATNRLATLPAIARSNYPAAYTTGRDIGLTTDLSGVAWVGNLPVGLTTYTAVGSATLASNPTDFALLAGNATNTVILSRISVSCTLSTATVVDIYVFKRSAANTGGTSGAPTITPLDSNNAAASSGPIIYTVNPTQLGANVGQIDRRKILMPATGTTANDVYVWTPPMGQSVVLRGTAQSAAVNFNGQTLTGGVCDGTFTWIESTGL